MTPTLAVLLFGIATLVLLGAVSVAVLALRNERRVRARLDVAERELFAHEEAMTRLVELTLPRISDAVRRDLEPVVTAEVPAPLQGSPFAQKLARIAAAHAEDLHRLRHDTAADVEQAAEERTVALIEAAETAARAQVAADARAATSSAVRAFGTTVVSLGADVGQVVSNALRENRNDEVYAVLSRIDHTVQQMIRQAQSYVIVSGGLPGRRWPQQTVTEVVGGATSRVRDYLRVRAGSCDQVIVSRAVEPLVHTVATLLDNALRYSPPSSFVDISFQEGHHGVTLIIDDAGVRMSQEQMEEARQVLSGERVVDINSLGPSPRVGFPGVAALARRYGFAAYVDGPNIYGGTRAMVFIPAALLVSAAELRRPELEQPAPSAPEPAQAEPAAPVAPPEPAPEPVALSLPEPETTGRHRPPAEAPAAETSTEDYARTTGGLPKRRRRGVTPLDERTDTAENPGRPELAAAWHSGSRLGRAAAEQSTEGQDIR
ncbi:ATP-binding protein [Nocardia neocaledoniensis]|uniref:ATP-binding protein n=1 Tax=Nocardia neocaledoniensis TaxID=236511 RepID=UPI0024549126|nr:ATP-binding protein [Nocardia neocaledoniensis]